MLYIQMLSAAAASQRRHARGQPHARRDAFPEAAEHAYQHRVAELQAARPAEPPSRFAYFDEAAMQPAARAVVPARRAAAIPCTGVRSLALQAHGGHIECVAEYHASVSAESTDSPRVESLD